MSERMIELQRAKMLSQSSRGSMPNQSPASASIGKNAPHQAAVLSLHTEDQQMHRFLNRMQRRDDAQQFLSDTTSGPTVPTALSRRLFQRQGVGYLDDTVAAIASASADRFLATVLHQSVACRDQRLKGSEMEHAARRHRKRHVEQYQTDTDDRRKRKLEVERQRERANLTAIAAADALKKGGNAGSKKDSDGATKIKKKKKAEASSSGVAPQANGNKKKCDPNAPGGNEEESFDSLDEEEEFYHNYYGIQEDSDESDEEDETLRLVDLKRPLEAWDFHITGKLGLDLAQAEYDSEEYDDSKHDDDKSAQTKDDEGDPNAKDIVLDKDKSKIADEALLSSSPKRHSKAAPANAPLQI